MTILEVVTAVVGIHAVSLVVCVLVAFIARALRYRSQRRSMRA